MPEQHSRVAWPALGAVPSTQDSEQQLVRQASSPPASCLDIVVVVTCLASD